MQVTMYTTEWCGHCKRLSRQMTEAGIEYTEVDVDATSSFDEAIRGATGGFRTVPTRDVGGTLLVNPTIDQIRQALQAA
jgi:mycoredoxin